MSAAPKLTEAKPGLPNLDALLRLLSTPLPLERQEELQSWVAEFEPTVVAKAMDALDSKHRTQDLDAAMAPVVARWYRERRRVSPERPLKFLFEQTSSKHALVVRLAAIDALGLTESTNPTVRDQLELLLKDESPAIREAAEDAIYNLFG